MVQQTPPPSSSTRLLLPSEALRNTLRRRSRTRIKRCVRPAPAAESTEGGRRLSAFDRERGGVLRLHRLREGEGRQSESGAVEKKEGLTEASIWWSSPFSFER